MAGVQLPSKYMWRELKPIMLLVGPGMACMWMATSLLVWGLIRPPSFLHALAVGACVTPTDPVLSAVIVKGKFADKNIPKELQNLIVAESGTNDGLGYPFLFFALYLIKFIGASATEGNAGDAIGLWFAITWAYTIILSILYGAAVGLLAKFLLRWAEDRGFVDRESFLVFAISLALFVLGTCGMIGTDDVLACFIAGNTFTWDDWFRLETKDDSLQPTIDMLLNVTIFLWYGAVIPWHDFANSAVIPLYRLAPLGLLVLLVRRLPWVYGLHKFIHQIEQHRQAIFVGFFGPIGVSAVFYLFITLAFIEEHLSDENGVPREDSTNFAETVRIVVWFLVVCSVVVHGLSIPLGKLGYLAPRTLSRALSENASEDGLNSRQLSRQFLPGLGRRITSRKDENAASAIMGRRIPSSRPESIKISRPPSRLRNAEAGEDSTGDEISTGTPSRSTGFPERSSVKPLSKREIRFPDE